MSEDLKTRIVISGDAESAVEAAKRTRDGLEEVAQTARKGIGAIDGLDKATRDLEATRLSAKAAKDRLAELKAQSAQGLNVEGIAQAKRELDAAKEAAKAAKDRLAELRTQAKLGAPVEGLDEAKRDLDAAKDAAKAAKDRLVELKTQAKEKIESGAVPLAADLRAAEKAAKALASEEERGKVAVQALSEKLRAAGVDTANLAAEKTRLAAKAQAAEKGVVGMNAKLVELKGEAAAAAKAAKQAGDAAERTGKQSAEGADGVDRLATGMKALAGAAVLREFVQANASLEGMTRALEAVTGSSEAARQEMEYVRGESMRLGLEVGSAANSYVQLAASAKGTALEGAATRDIWGAVSESMALLGKSTADTQGALLAISQMMSKGVVSAEELRGQLGERLPGAFSAAARAMNTTTRGLHDMLQKGEIVAADFLPRFAAELRKTGGAGGDVDTFTANLNRLKNSTTEVFQAIGNTGVFSLLSDAISKTGEAIGFFTQSAKLMRAAFTGNEAATEQAREKYEASARSLFGLKKAMDDTAESSAAMAKTVESSAVRIADVVGAKISGAILKLNAEIKTTDQAFKNLGVDPDEIITGIGRAERAIIDSFKKIASDPAVSGEVLLASLLVALDKVGKEAVPELGFAFKMAAKRSKESTDVMAAGLNAIDTKLKDLWPTAQKTASEVESAFTRMGLATKAALAEAAEQSKRDFETIKTSGLASAGTIAQAWEKYAHAAIASGDALRIEMARQQAVVLNLQKRFQELIDTEKKHRKDRDERKPQEEEDRKRIEDMNRALAQQAAELERVAEAERKAAEEKRKAQAFIGQITWDSKYPGWSLLTADEQKALILKEQQVTNLGQLQKAERDIRDYLAAVVPGRSAQALQAGLPAKTVNVNLQLAGRTVPVQVDAANESALMGMLEQIAGARARTA